MIYSITRNGSDVLGSVDLDLLQPYEQIAAVASEKCESFMTAEELDKVERAFVQKLSWPEGFMLAVEFPPICMFGVEPANA